MSRHLSQAQILEYLSGCRSPGAERHLANCAECKAEIEWVGKPLAQLRLCVRAWSDGCMGAEPRIAHGKKRLMDWTTAAAAGAAMAALLLAITMSLSTRGKTTARELPARDSGPADAALLENVAREASRTAPRGMEPLLRLLSPSARPGADAAMDMDGEGAVSSQ